MPKEAYYFSHDSNARNDEKIVMLRMKHGWKGYGIYWALVEKLRDSADYFIANDYKLIAFEFKVPADLIRSIVEDFSLFILSENKSRFTSNSLLKRMKLREDKSIKARESINKRWKKGDDTNVLPTNNGSNTIKGKEKKGKETIVPVVELQAISKEKVIEFLKQSAIMSMEEAGIEADKLMNHYRGQRITDLKKVCYNWATIYSKSLVMPAAQKKMQI